MISNTSLPDSNIKHFNIRVYGILHNDRQEVLISDEYVLDRYMIKFPGGGLMFGEGPEDCMKRESKEELGQDIEIISHFYTTGFFQKALFYDDQQLISIYYKIRLVGKPVFRISEKPFDFNGRVNGSQSFRWVKPEDIGELDLTFPIDRYVIKLLKSNRG